MPFNPSGFHRFRHPIPILPFFMDNYSLFIARRMSLASNGGKNSPAIKVAVAAVALSVAVMLAAVAIVLGFKKEIHDKAVGFNSHITLYAASHGEEGNTLTLTPTLANMMSDLPFVKEFNIQSVIPAILKTSTDFKGVYLKGLVGDQGRQFMQSNLIEGSVPDYSKEENRLKVLISEKAARELGLKTGDNIDTYFISDDVRVRRLKVAGVYNSHFEAYDDILVFGDIATVQQLGLLQPNQGTALLINVDDFDQVEQHSAEIQNKLTQALADGILYRQYIVENVQTQSAGLFRWLSLLDMNVAVVLALMTVVACITLISGMLIIILDKKRFIGLMKALGAPSAAIRRIFIYLAIKIAAIGLAIGNILMLALLFIQKHTHFIPLDPDSYYIDFVPVEISWISVAVLNLGVLIVIYVALVLPSRSVAKVSPAETMRYE